MVALDHPSLKPWSCLSVSVWGWEDLPEQSALHGDFWLQHHPPQLPLATHRSPVWIGWRLTCPLDMGQHLEEQHESKNLPLCLHLWLDTSCHTHSCTTTFPRYWFLKIPAPPLGICSFFVAMPRGMEDLCSLTRYWTLSPCNGSAES